jgi:hypothetical protein
MRAFVVVLLCCVMGASWGESLLERIRARGRCRRVLVQNHEVIVRFTCQEDADLFARDLKSFLGD